MVINRSCIDLLCLCMANSEFVPQSLQFSSLLIPGTRSNIYPHEDLGPTRHTYSDYAGQAPGPGGSKAIIAESLLVKHQQLIAHRSTGKTLRLTTSDRFLCGILVLFMHPRRIRKAAVVLKPATLTKFRRALFKPQSNHRFTRRIISCGIAGCHLDQTVGCSLFAAGIPVIEASKSLSPAHDPYFSHHRCRRKLLGVGPTQTVPVFPRAPPFAERRIGTRRRNHHDYRSNCGAIDLATEHEALNNYCHLFLMPNPLDENRSSKTNRETALSHAESPNFALKRYIREELRTLIAA
jgi:hypothetical protein